MGEDRKEFEQKGELARQLHHPEEEVRRQAIEELHRRAGAENLALLSEGLGDLSWRVRKTAVNVIVNYPDYKSAITILINALYDAENVGRRTSAIEALVRIGEKTVADLVEACQTYDPDVRKFVLDILGEIGSKRALPLLLKIIEDQDENVRLAAVEALGKIGGPEAREKLLELVNSGNDLIIRFSALHLLGKSGSALPAEMIERLLQERMFRRAVFEVLGESPTKESVDFLLPGLTDPAKSARQAAIHSLARIYELDQSGALQERIAAGVQGTLNDQNLGLVREFLEGNHISTRRDALKLISLIENDQILHYLFGLSQDDSFSDDLALILERISQRRSDLLKKELKKESEEVRETVRRLLQEEKGLLSFADESKLQLGDSDFEQVRDRISLSYGIYFDLEMKYLAERRILQRMNKIGLRKFSDYLARLENAATGQEELYALAQLLVNNETYFFREDFQLKTFAQEIMPELIEAAVTEGRSTLKVWSAGCSSGEEAYTLAMLICERNDLGSLGVEIYGTDLDEEMIGRAQRGLYGSSSFRVISEYFSKKYFIPRGRKYQLSDAVRGMVKFNCANLLSFGSSRELQNLDAIFCRNVLIYFSLEAKQALVEKFHQALRPGGFLLLGHSESLLNLSTAFRVRHFKHDLVHQKPTLKEREWKKN